MAQLLGCGNAACEYTPWFPDEGTLDVGFGEKNKTECPKAYLQDEKSILIKIWTKWM